MVAVSYKILQGNFVHLQFVQLVFILEFKCIIYIINSKILIPRKYYVYLPQLTNINAHLETVFMRAFNFITRSIMTRVMYGIPSRTLLLKQQIS